MRGNFELEGFYNNSCFRSGRCNLDGEISFSDDGLFGGEVYIDSSIPKQFVKGFFRSEKGLDSLKMVSAPLGLSNFVGLAYFLNKESNGKFEGDYIGRWGVPLSGFSFDSDIGLYLADLNIEKCNMESRVDISFIKK